MTYSDKVVTVTFVADSYLKLSHAFKVDQELWLSAQTDVYRVIEQLEDEGTTDSAVVTLLDHLDRFKRALQRWL